MYINSSQGEAALADLISAIKNNGDISKVNNIHYKLKNSYIKTEIKEENNLLNENMVDWTLFKNRLGKFANLRTAISCPYACAFCGFPQHAGKYQTTDVDKIEQELNSLKEAGNVESINFIDDTFNVPAERFKDILRMMIRNKYNFKWHSYFRCQFADEETISLMKESGCEGVFLGIESGNEQILKNMNKAAALDKYRNGIKLLRENNIITFASFIVGFPGETRETVQDTINFIEETKPDFYRAQLWYCEPITPVWNEKDKYNIKGSNFEWSHATMDSKTGCDLIEEMFLNVKNSVWLSQYNFDFVNLFHMLQRGLSLQEIKHFVNGFNLGVKHKLLNAQAPEITSAIIEQLKAVKRKQ
jgi:radical SAM PhpK family P-methyltransferase